MEAELSRYAVYVFAAIAGVILAETAYLLMSASSGSRRAVNRRMRLTEKTASQKDVLYQLRKERGLDGASRDTSLTKVLHRMRLQAAMKMPLAQFASVTTLASLLIGVTAGLYFNVLAAGLLGAAVLMIVMPIVILRMRRSARHKAFGAQLPEALDLITRGLKAGHPVPIAIAMVAREMPDPIGTEFGIMSDEVTYGADFVIALEALFERVGHEDLPLFVTAVKIQSTTGGNLREILDGLSHVIRERAKLRRKIKAISIEGRMSAYILTAVPVFLIAALNVLVPDYYGDVIDNPLTWYLGAGAGFWLLVGNVILFKLAAIKP
ncbi:MULTISPECIES: type II secretion system F family protein [unclassified Roseitalea]|uniref:type II secretion system F family protein n=1 Tax=unclassified Roseitalea TaxID=2639107 RepID=UPI00273F021D|nr:MULTISPECIES: type II secretion system F family protein [unclassified Roseitalea]